eukprot:gene1067-biopygen2810
MHLQLVEFRANSLYSLLFAACRTLPLTSFSPNQLRDTTSAVCVTCAAATPNPVNAARAAARDPAVWYAPRRVSPDIGAERF